MREKSARSKLDSPVGQVANREELEGKVGAGVPYTSVTEGSGQTPSWACCVGCGRASRLGPIPLNAATGH